jgi:hypothetical protein
MQAVITCFFNPNQCPYRLNNYKHFYSNLKRIGLPVYAVEIVFGESDFQLTEQDADWLKQLRGQHIMFQKERMLNIALDSLPSDVDQVIWMDCDLFFFEDDWVDRVAKSLKSYKVIQPYNISISLPKCSVFRTDDWQTMYYDAWGSGRIKRSFAYYHEKRKTFPNLHHGHLGYVWAAQREFLDKHKFYDTIITGAGDLFMTMAFIGSFGWLEYPKELLYYPEAATEHYFNWAFPVYEETKGHIGYTHDVVFHMWHGDINNRDYLSWTNNLQTNRFNPNEDLLLGENGCWNWNSEKPKLHKALKDMFICQNVA